MNVVRALLCGGAIVALGYSAAAYADDPANDPVQPQVQKKIQIQPGRIQVQPLQGRLGGGNLISDRGLEKLELSKDQKEKYDKINQEYLDKQKDIQAKLQEAIQGKDRDKIREAIQTLRTGGEKLRNEQLDKVEPILTDAQKKTFGDVRKENPQRPGIIPNPRIPGGAAPGQILPPNLQDRLKLTDEQKKKLQDLQKDVDGKLRDLLTEEQRKMLEDLRQGPRIQPRQPQLRKERLKQ